MGVNSRSIKILQKHLHLLSADKQAIGRFLCTNWPLQARIPRGVAALAESAYGFSVRDLPGTERVARQLFLESATLAREASSRKA
jgi:hypothetical protein